MHQIIHKEGKIPIGVATVVVLVLSVGIWLGLYERIPWLTYGLLAILGAVWLWVISFFRNPSRPPVSGEDHVLCPADGTVVVVEHIEEAEYFGDTRMQVSIFMSPMNVHFNKVPVSGEVVYKKYYPGKYLVAWHPKSSELNERLSVAIHHDSLPVLVRQIAGAMARRIRNYIHLRQVVTQGDELGFIKFGSRVDVLMPPDVEVCVQLGQKVKANTTILARQKK